MARVANSATLALAMPVSAEPNPKSRAHTVAPAKPKPSPKCADATKINDAVLTVDDMPTGFAEVQLNPANTLHLGGSDLSAANSPVPTVAKVKKNVAVSLALVNADIIAISPCRGLDPAVTKAKLDGLTFHGLRHSAVGLMIEVGAHLEAIKQRLGHSSIRVTSDVYGSVLPAVDAGGGDGT